MRKSVNIIVRITVIFMIIGATVNTLGGILLARGGSFPPTPALLSWAFDGSVVGLVIGAVIGILVALTVGGFKKYIARRHQG